MVDLIVNQHIQYHLNVITDKRAFIVDLSDLIPNYIQYRRHSESVLAVDLNYINTCTDDYDIIIINHTTGYLKQELEETICDQLKQYQLSKPWIIITSDFKYYNQQHSHIVYYPIYLIDGLDKGNETSVEFKNHRSHTVCFLTYHYYWHRLLILLELYKRMNFESCLVNLPMISQLNTIQAQSLENSFFDLTAEEKQMVNEMFKMSPIVADPTDPKDEIVNLKNGAFHNSYINIFTESDYAYPMVTEKSIKPFLSGQFFAVFGHPSAYAHLKELGFDLFEDYLPMPQHQDFRQDLNELMNMIDELTPKLADAWDNTYNRRLHNYTLARSAELRNKLCYELCTRLNNI
jgi:hypothetical protein